LSEEVRSVFIHSVNTQGIDAEIACATLEPYGINLIVLEALGANYARYPSDVIKSYDWNILPEFVDSAHAHGMKLYVSMNVIAEQNIALYDPDGMTIRYNDGSPIAGATANPLNPQVRALLKAEVEELVTKYDIDGFMFDYLLFVWGDEPYDDISKADFIAKTGLTDVIWGPDTHVQSGKYWTQFWQWRCIVLNDLIRDMRTWMLAKKPDLKFSAAAWNFAFSRDYWKIWIGQDSVAWVEQGIVDWVSPMMYYDDVNKLMSHYSTLKAAFPSNTEINPFIDSCLDGISTPQNLADRITALQEVGAGWIIWRYGGPGDASGSPDLRLTFDLLGQPPPDKVTPFSQLLKDGIKEISVPPTVNMYKFKQWDDGETNPTRTINLTTDTTINADYELISIINGKVVDAKTMQPIISAQVECNGKQTTTDELGNYSFIDLSPLIYTLVVSSAGYTGQSIEVDASAGGTFTQDFSLTLSPLPINKTALALGTVAIVSVVGAVTYIGQKKKR